MVFHYNYYKKTNGYTKIGIHYVHGHELLMYVHHTAILPVSLHPNKIVVMPCTISLLLGTILHLLSFHLYNYTPFSTEVSLHGSTILEQGAFHFHCLVPPVFLIVQWVQYDQVVLVIHRSHGWHHLQVGLRKWSRECHPFPQVLVLLPDVLGGCGSQTERLFTL